MREQKNTAKNTKYYATITDLTSLILTTQSANVPTISISAIETFNNSAEKFLFGGNTITYEPINIDFIVSEDHSEWIDLFKWIMLIVSSDDHKEIMRTMEITVMDNQNNIIHSYIYTNCIITNLSGFTYVTNEEENIIVSNATIEFQNLSIRYKDGSEVSLLSN